MGGCQGWVRIFGVFSTSKKDINDKVGGGICVKRDVP